LGPLLLEHLLQDGPYILTYSGLDIQLHVVLEVLMLFRGQVSPSSLETHNLPDAIQLTGPYPYVCVRKKLVL
jgi:hypothetical protein